ncbi:chloride channel protein [Lacrimispora defluvii]|uniref:Voltage-gated chloride channel protein n=1 Tax=Lacrimispora defluvii TaxID=2719233 RepID=A0ABX1VLS0_9FIRM|nr:chloride channel protein [Lacrimispora defluvii]NNJ29308.1 voltage-gated chloride channel protein [Lacrimispora defluvii]
MFLEKLKNIRQLIILGICAVVIGAVAGALDAGFGEILIFLTGVRERYFFPLILFLPAAGVIIAKAYSLFGGNCVKGMGLIFQVGHGEEDVIPLRLIPFTVIGTWLTHLFGGSAGREGVAVQIGATVSHWAGRKLNLVSDSKIFLVTGMAAGFSGLFQTPMAACFFALEVLIAGSLQYTALFPAVIAAFVATWVSGSLGLEKFHYNLQTQIQLDPVFIIKIILSGIIFGLVGAMFAHGLKMVKDKLNNRFKSPVSKIAIVGTFLVILLILPGMGRYSGLGTNLISASFYGNKIYPWDWILKIVLTIITLAAGYQGGEVTPLFSIGSGLGAALAVILGLPVEFAAALGYTAVFGSATNTLLAPVFIGAEVFGYSYVPYFFLVCCVAYVFNDNKSIYTAQKNLQDML